MPLLDAYGRPIKSQDLTREHAAPSLTGVRTIWDDTVASGLTPMRLAGLLRGAVLGETYEYLTLAEEMEERDLHYACELGKRKLAVSRLPVTVEAYSDDAKDQKLADSIRSLVRKPGFRGLLKDLLDSLGKGYSASEIIWQRGAQWLPVRYEHRDPRFFQFDQVSRRELRLRDEADLMNGLQLAPYKFIVHVPHLKSGLPIRGGLARLAAWAWMCKNYTVKDWMAFAEVFGMPLRVGKYRPGANSDDISILKMAVANLGSDAAAVIPESMLIDLVERKGGAGGETVFQVLADWFDSQVSRGILGQTASSSGTPGRLGDDKLQSEVRDDIRDDDAEQLAETINRDLVRAYIDLNFGPQENYPQVILRDVSQEDVAAISDSLAKLVPLGLKVEQSVVRDRLGWPDPAPNAKPEDLLDGQPAALPPSIPAKAENRQQTCPGCGSARNSQGDASQDTVDLLADQSMAEADGTDMVAEVYRLLAECGSLEEAQEKLLDIYDRIPLAATGETLGNRLFQADLTGRAEVIDEVGNG